MLNPEPYSLRAIEFITIPPRPAFHAILYPIEVNGVALNLYYPLIIIKYEFLHKLTVRTRH